MLELDRERLVLLLLLVHLGLLLRRGAPRPPGLKDFRAQKF